MSVYSLGPSLNIQVFLCFRGQDVRYNFLESLHRRLKSFGIYAFRDTEGIRAGEPIIEKLLKTIGDAQLCVPIFSKDFASSTSCLMEVDQMCELERNIIPIFYGVEPNIVRRQLGSYEEPFRKHACQETPEVVEKWRNALNKVSWIRGEVLPDVEKGYQDLIDKVVNRLSDLLKIDCQRLPIHHVDVSHHVQDVLKKLGIDYDGCGKVKKEQRLSGKHVVGIYGQQGIGKTTLAKVVYNSIRPLFDIGCGSFLHNVKGMVAKGTLLSSQKQLIQNLQGSLQNHHSLEEGIDLIVRQFKNRAVLIVLDDVDQFEQTKQLLGELDWLGTGSRVLLTSGKKDLIKRFEGQGLMVSGYELGPLPHGKAEELFCWHAFRSYSPEEGFAEIATGITEKLLGIPRYIELVGSCLYGKENYLRAGLWQEMQEMLKAEPEERVEILLKPSCSDLEENTNRIFLDIACLFNGMDKTIPWHLWKECGSYPNWGIYHLWNWSWLKFGGNNVLLQMLEDKVKCGKRKVMDEDDHPLKRSRIWDTKDAERALEDAKGRNGRKVKALCLANDIQQPVGFSFPQLCFLSNLRVLRLSCAKLRGNLPKIVHGQGRASMKRELPELRWLSWKGQVDVSLFSQLHAERLVILDLSSSGASFAESTECWQSFFKGVKKLKVLNLSGCSGVSLVFRFPMSLERLILDHCCSPFPRQGNTVCNLVNLVYLSIRYSRLGKELPPDLLKLRALRELLIDGTGIVSLSDDLVKRLEVLSANDCKDLEQIPEFQESGRIRVLSFKGCQKVCKIPESIGKLVCLEELDLSETLIREVPRSFVGLPKLRKLSMRKTFLKEVPDFLNEMASLEEKDFSDLEV